MDMTTNYCVWWLASGRRLLAVELVRVECDSLVECPLPSLLYIRDEPQSELCELVASEIRYLHLDLCLM